MTVALPSPTVLLLDPELTFLSMLRTKEALLPRLPPSPPLEEDESEEMLCCDLCLFHPTFLRILSMRAEEALDTMDRALLLSSLLLFPADKDLLRGM